MNEPVIEGPKPIAVQISVNDVRVLFACGTQPDQYNQLLLAKLKDAGVPVEGDSRLRLAHGQVFKLKDSMLEPLEEFTYMWLPENYVWSLKHADKVATA
jgi:hypothetical protein